MTFFWLLSALLYATGLLALISWLGVRHTKDLTQRTRVSNWKDVLLFAMGAAISWYGILADDPLSVTATLWGMGFLLGMLLIRWVGRRYAYAPPIRADEIHYARTGDLWKLRICRYRPHQDIKGEPVVLCHGLASNQYFFTMPTGEALVDVLNEHGYDCWVVDLRGTRSSIPAFGRNLNQPIMEDHLFQDIPGLLHYVQEATGFPRVHWIGHSMGGMLGYAHALLSNNAGLATLTLIGSPLSLQGRVLRIATLPIFIRALSRQACRALFYVAVRMAGALRFHSKYSMISWKNLHPRIKPRQVYDGLEAPPLRVLLNLTRSVRRRKWMIRNDSVDLFEYIPELSLPVMGVYGVADGVARADHMAPRFDLIQSEDKRLLLAGKQYHHQADYDHGDLLLGRAAREDVFEPIAAWLEGHPLAGNKRDTPAKGMTVSSAHSPKKKPAKPKAAPAAQPPKGIETPDIPIKKKTPRKKPAGVPETDTNPTPIAQSGRRTRSR